MERLTRKLAVILAADCVAFSKMMDQNEELTLKNLKTCRDIVDPIITEYGGRIFHTAGDSVIAEFASPVSSVEAAIEFQQILADRNKNVPEESQITFRVGIHLDDVIIDPANYPDTARLHIPSENFLMGLLAGQDHLLICAWPPGSQRVTLQAANGTHRGLSLIHI